MTMSAPCGIEVALEPMEQDELINAVE